MAAFDLPRAPIFFGRGRARNDVRDLLAEGIAAGSPFVLVIGASGSGRSPATAQEERYRRDAEAWQLPRDEVGRLMEEAEGR